jgi:two-component system LytT family response regulator
MRESDFARFGIFLALSEFSYIILSMALMEYQMRKIRVLIVDDERPARQRIGELLEKEADIEIVGECNCGADAVKLIQGRSPDLLFLDIQMPEMNGFEVLQAAGVERAPVTIFVTAYDQYAIRAFEVNALDYLLKPYSDERFEAALMRARNYLHSQKNNEFSRRLLSLLNGFQAENNQSAQSPQTTQQLDRLVIKSLGRVFFLKTEEIDWIEAAGVYVSLHVRGKTHLYRETIGGLEPQLDAIRFVRIHRSTMVNIDRIKELQPYSHGEYLVILHDGTKLKLSRGYRAQLQERLGQSL